MRDSLISAFLTALGTKEASRIGDKVIASCPAAFWLHGKNSDKHPSFAVWREAGTRCNCFGCQTPHVLSALVWQISHWNKLDPSGAEYDFAKAFELLEQQEGGDPLIAKDETPTAGELAFMPPPGRALARLRQDRGRRGKRVRPGPGVSDLEERDNATHSGLPRRSAEASGRSDACRIAW